MALKENIKQDIIRQVESQLNKAENSNVDIQYFNHVIDEINNINVCSELQYAINDVMHAVQSQINNIETQLAQLSPLIALLELSITDLPGVIKAVESIIENMVAPYVMPYIKYLLIAVAVVQEVEKLTTAVENAIKRIEGGCSITIPPLSFVPPVSSANAVLLINQTLASFNPPIDPNNPPTSI